LQVILTVKFQLKTTFALATDDLDASAQMLGEVLFTFGYIVYCEYFCPDYETTNEHSPDEWPDEMFRFIKVMKK
jgi:hypothetical protein